MINFFAKVVIINHYFNLTASPANCKAVKQSGLDNYQLMLRLRNQIIYNITLVLKHRLS